MEQYNVTGMSCAACSARVEKAVSKVDGVTSCSVSLLTNSMGVEGTASPEAIIDAVQKAGYGASRKGGSDEAAAPDSDALADHENTSAETAADRLCGISGSAHVYLYGTYDVGIPPALVLQQQPCGNGSGADAAYHYHHGHQPEILRQRIPEPAPPCPEYGHTGGTGVPVRHSYTVPTPCLP